MCRCFRWCCRHTINFLRSLGCDDTASYTVYQVARSGRLHCTSSTYKGSSSSDRLLKWRTPQLRCFTNQTKSLSSNLSCLCATSRSTDAPRPLVQALFNQAPVVAAMLDPGSVIARQRSISQCMNQDDSISTVLATAGHFQSDPSTTLSWLSDGREAWLSLTTTFST
jgi:hypothetical protein